MGRVEGVVYECDNPNCNAKFFDKDEVFLINGCINNGDADEMIGSSMLCHDCLLQFLYVDRDKINHIIELSNELEDEMASKEKERDEDIYDEDEFDD